MNKGDLFFTYTCNFSNYEGTYSFSFFTDETAIRDDVKLPFFWRLVGDRIIEWKFTHQEKWLPWAPHNDELAGLVRTELEVWKMIND